MDADLATALRLALDGGDPTGVEPIDWLTTTCPQLWHAGGTELRYNWLEDWGADPFEQFTSG